MKPPAADQAKTSTRDQIELRARSFRRTLLLWCIAVLLLGAPQAYAVFIWDGDGGTNLWTNGLNWQGGTAPSGNINDSLLFGGLDIGDRIITDADGSYRKIAGISFTGAQGGFTISGSGSFSIDSGSTIGGDSGYTHTINVELTSNSAGVMFDSTDNFIVNAAIGGSGGISKSGSSTLTLNGDNSYHGMTLIEGTLVLGHDNALGHFNKTFAVSGDGTIQSDDDSRSIVNAVSIADTKTLTVSGTNNLILSGDISGNGALGKSDSSTLTLTGDNTYTGGTTLSGGTLVGSTSSLQGAIANNATVIFDQAVIGVYSDVMSGTGMLIKQGEGLMTLSGLNTYTGGTVLSAGTLNLGGQVYGDVTVNAGIFVGTGTIANGGSLTVNSGGTFAPGHSIGTTTITGNYIQNAGSTLEVEVEKTGDGALNSDLVDVTGSATLESGSQIGVTDLTDSCCTISTGDTFTIIKADGGVVDNGVSVIFDSAVLSFAGVVSGNSYQLIAARSDFSSRVFGANNKALMSAVEADRSAATGDYAVLISELTTLGSSQLNDAAEKLNPLPYASAALICTTATQKMAGSLASHLRTRRADIAALSSDSSHSSSRPLMIAAASPDPQLLAHWIRESQRLEKNQAQQIDRKAQGFVKPFGTLGEQDSTPKLTGFHASSTGVELGIDQPVTPNLVAGVGGGYIHSFISFRESRGEGDVDSLRIGPYATYFNNDLFVDTSLSFGYHFNQIERDIEFGSIERTARADYDAYDLSAYIGVGRDLGINGWILTPSLSFQYINYRSESYRETDAGSAGLKIDARTIDSFQGKLGLELSTIAELGQMRMVPEVFAGWAHEFLDDENIEARFVDGAAKFTATVDDERDDSVYYGAGISALLREDISAFVRYQGESYSGSQANLLSVGVKLLF